MNERSDFERRLQAAFDGYAEGVDVDVDAAGVTRSVARPRRGGLFGLGQGRANRVLVYVVLVLLLIGALAASFWLGSQLIRDPRRPLSELASPTPAATASATAPPTAAATVTEPPPSIEPGGATGPCAPMVQLLSTWITDVGIGLPAGPTTRHASVGEVVIATRNQFGGTFASRFDVSSGLPTPINIGTNPDLVFPSGGMPMAAQGGIYPSADGRAMALDEGDFGTAGCGDPIVALADGGRIRPFPSHVFERVSTLAWATDGSALYGVRRTTDSQPVPDGSEPYDSNVGSGPGTLLRWDSSTGVVTDLGSPCAGCILGAPRVSPDGSIVALQPFGPGVPREIALFSDGEWQTVAMDDTAAGSFTWLDDNSLLFQSLAVIGLDGLAVRTLAPPCCHGTGYSGPLSPDRTTVAGKTLNSDFVHFSVTLLNVADGSSRDIWTVPDIRGCSAFEGGSGEADCLAANPETPGPDAISGYSRVVAWAPDGSAVLVFDAAGNAVSGADPSESAPGTGWLIVVKTDGSGSPGRTRFDYPTIGAFGDLGFAPAVAWLPNP